MRCVSEHVHFHRLRSIGYRCQLPTRTSKKSFVRLARFLEPRAVPFLSQVISLDTQCVSMCYGVYMSLKDSGMRIRVEKELRDAFLKACHSHDRVASDVLRDFMRTYAEKQYSGQADLFVGANAKLNQKVRAD